MTTPLIDLSKLANHAVVFADSAKACGFTSPGDIDRFLFKSYGKAVREIPPANRLKGGIFFLDPPTTFKALAQITDLKNVLLQIRTDIAQKFYVVPSDLSSAPSVAHEPSNQEQKLMASGAWTMGQAQLLSRQSGRCVIWANGVSATAFLAGDCYIETPDVVEELPSGLPTSFQHLSWADGEIVFEFAKHDLNDTTPAGIWHLADHFLLRPKPEKLMSVKLGKFLKHRMAGYRHHEDEGHVENQGRADVSLNHYNGMIDIIEVKWVGSSLISTKELETKGAIKSALKRKAKGWLTQYGEDTFVAGAKQLAVYLDTGNYRRGYLVVFDCKPPAKARQSESILLDKAHVAPLNPADFRVLRACVDPRKASTVSKAKQP